MRAIKRNTRAKLSYNPTGELIRILTRIIKIKIARRLRAFRAAACLILLSTASCTVDPVAPDTCPGGCDAQMLFPVQADTNGYYHIGLDWTGEYLPWFYVDIKATPTAPEYQYNGDSVVEARFDSNTSWVLGDDLVIQQPIYTPFGSYTSNWLPIPTSWVDVKLPQYKGEEINIAQNTSLYFSEKNGSLYSRRILGPFPPAMKGDTITVYMRVFWEAGEHSVLKDNFSQKFIVE
jgi:hypothetical protein